MSTIAFLITILAIISTILSSSIGPREWGHEVDSGVLTADYIEGYIGERPFTGPDGDYLRTAFCYCRTAVDGNSAGPALQKRLIVSGGNRDGEHTHEGGIRPGEIVQGHFWRWEYFNYHYNTTYFLKHYCMEDAVPHDNHGCGSDRPGKFNPVPGGEKGLWDTIPQVDMQFSYSPLPGHEKHTWMIMKKVSDIDWMFFGRGDSIHMQKRRLGKDQGLIDMPKDYVEKTCSVYCDTEMLLPMDGSMFNHAELYNDVDDMCDRCH